MQPAIPIRQTVLALALAGVCAQAQGQIATDGKLGAATALAGPNHRIGAALGRQVGPNLFHSFASFNLSAGQSATFIGTPGVETRNILSRVTGGVSSIDGLIKMDRATLPGANFFLINPKGILFGPNASFDLTGSFHASTADYIRLGDGGRFDAASPANDVLTAAPPAAFGFLGPNAGAITVNGANLSVRDGATGALREAAGVSLVAGAVTISDAAIHSRGGDIRLIGLVGAREIPVSTPDDELPGSLQPPIQIERTAVRSESGGGAPGRIVIRGGSVAIIETALISNNGSDMDAPPIDVHGGTIQVSASLAETYSHAAGAGADVRVSGRNVRMDRATTIGTQALNKGRGGEVRVRAEEALTLVSTASDPDYTYLYTSTSGTGASGAMHLAADRFMFDAPYIFSLTAGPGDTGPILLNAREANLLGGSYILTMSDPGTSGRTSAVEVLASERIHLGGLDPFGFKAEIFNYLQGSGHARNILLRAPEVLVKGANIETVSALGSGNAGTVRVEGNVVRFIAGDGAHARAASIARNASSGDGGNVEVYATRSFEMNGNGFLGDWTHFVTATEGSGRGGDIIVKAPSITVDRGTLFARTRWGTGATGGILVEADSVVLRNEGGIGSVTEGPSKGSTVTIKARSLEAFDTSGINAGTTGSGDAGNILIEAQRVRLTGASAIGVGAADGGGKAGDIVLEIGASFEMTDRTVGTYQDLGGGGPRGADVWPGGINLSAGGAGSGGSLLLHAPIVVFDDGRIHSTAAREGDGGRVEIRADTLVLRNGAQIDAKSAPGSTGKAGSIVLVVQKDLQISGQSRIDGAFSGLYAQTQGSGRGGNIDMSADVVRLDHGLIRSSTAGAGEAGRIHIRAGDVLVTGGGWIDAGTSAGGKGAGGSITVEASRSIRVNGIDRTPPAMLSNLPTGVGVVPPAPGRVPGPFASTISSSTGGSGPGGNVTLLSPYITVADGAQVSANSIGTGRAGDIRIDTRPGSLYVNSGAVTTQAESGDGGNIQIFAGNRLHIKEGEVSTSVQGGQGGGGNIFIDPTFVILERAHVAANAFGGPGGNVTIRSGYFFASPDSVIEASSQLGVSGSVLISALQSGVAAVLPALPVQFFDASGLLRAACTPRVGGGSRLVDVGRGGVSGWHAGYGGSRYFSTDEIFAAPSAETPRLALPPQVQTALLGACPT